MSNRLPIKVNPYRCIEQRRLINGEILLSKLPRLKKILTVTVSKVKVSLEFMRNDIQFPILQGHLSVVLSLDCQRCLMPVEHKVNKILSLVLVTTDTEYIKLQESYDTYLVTDDTLFLPDLIEDELMLTLPMSIMHKQCETIHPETDVFFNNDDKNNKAVKENPFSALENLKDLK